MIIISDKNINHIKLHVCLKITLLLNFPKLSKKKVMTQIIQEELSLFSTNVLFVFTSTLSVHVGMLARSVCG